MGDGLRRTTICVPRRCGGSRQDRQLKETGKKKFDDRVSGLRKLTAWRAYHTQPNYRASRKADPGQLHRGDGQQWSSRRGPRNSSNGERQVDNVEGGGTVTVELRK